MTRKGPACSCSTAGRARSRATSCAALYPSRAAYVDAYRRGVDDLVAAGGLHAEYGAARYDDAEKIAADLDL